MDGILPFSVLKSKRVKYVRILEEQDINNESRNRQADFEKNLLDVTSIGLYILPEHEMFIRNYISYFYRNNLAVLFLALNIIHDNNFVNSQYYQPFVNFIQRRQLNDRGDKQDKQDVFGAKLNVELRAYTKKIQSLMSRLNMTYI